ncbi:molybdopterin-dependent oxidoreductase [Streptomyces sp. DSM 44915]|uniref:Molybdopterin-dependent oxidoreductase n=1 Tax=Streptomyces chisholmiae TaxID=3075540 RepID=A0ABU2JR77_9ACTN|nr:molybdopterin-dependent oxidoreductase [Streptomyces sp. DSM 44915]MDT0267480.1 molybdopterin-dependent oxidoreductase [Streptomyces sp. DSM 44915]
MRERRRRTARGALAALAGVLAVVAALAAAESLAALAVRREAGPVTAVGGAAIDRTPTAVKDWAIRTFGDQDKLVLRLGILAVLALLAAVAGVAALRWRRLVAVGALAMGGVGAVAAAGRPDAGSGDFLPALLAGAVTGAVLLVLVGWLDAAGGRGVFAPDGARRRFLGTAGALVAGSLTAGLLARWRNAAGAAAVAADRAALRLPAPASPAGPLPDGAALDVPGLTPFRTPSRDFYRVDTALTVPRVDVASWRLRLHGLGVARPLTFTFDDLLARDLVARRITLTCVSNEVGGPYVGNATWLGVPLAGLLAQAGVRSPQQGGEADQLVARSVDGMTLGTPLAAVLDGRDALLAVGMNGEPLPFDHGYPVRMVVPGLYGYVSACKWLTELELTTFGAFDPYWVRRGWAAEAPIKTQSRIDTPRAVDRPRAGRPVAVAGVAWAQSTGIDRVEVRIDEGAWEEAELAGEDSVDTWRQWYWSWTPTAGTHRVEVRATDRNGETQTADRVGTVPDGATGRHSVVVRVD